MVIEAMKKGKTGNPHSAAKKKSMNQRAIIEELVTKHQCYLMLFSQHKAPIPHARYTYHAIPRSVSK
jgi:hypothetical protein